MAPSMEPVTLDLLVMNSSPMVGREITLKKERERETCPKDHSASHCIRGVQEVWWGQGRSAGGPGGGFPGELTLEMRHQVVVVVGHFSCWHSLLL